MNPFRCALLTLSVVAIQSISAMKMPGAPDDYVRDSQPIHRLHKFESGHEQAPAAQETSASNPESFGPLHKNIDRLYELAMEKEEALHKAQHNLAEHENQLKILKEAYEAKEHELQQTKLLSKHEQDLPALPNDQITSQYNKYHLIALATGAAGIMVSLYLLGYTKPYSIIGAAQVKEIEGISIRGVHNQSYFMPYTFPISGLKKYLEKLYPNSTIELNDISKFNTYWGSISDVFTTRITIIPRTYQYAKYLLLSSVSSTGLALGIIERHKRMNLNKPLEKSTVIHTNYLDLLPSKVKDRLDLFTKSNGTLELLKENK